jgi:hypothetical protein
MADNNEQVKQATTNTFTKGMVKDYNETFIGDGIWTHARNAVNNSHDGQVGVIGNEPANISCITLPYTLIGVIHLMDDQWAVFSTDDTNSEIGVFDESECSYKKIVNASCLNFKRSNLITGAYRKRFDCERIIYWSDGGLNPDRVMDIDSVPFKYTESLVNGCITKLYSQDLDCEKIRLAAVIDYPSLELKKGESGGTLPNGTYQACIAYTINGVRISDYISITEPQSLFTHQNVSSSLDLVIKNIDKDFDEFELVLLTNINSQSVAKRIGYYSTTLGTIHIDRWDTEYETVPVSQVVFRSEFVERSDAMYNVNDYLMRVGYYSKFKFNYQKQANKITSRWVAVNYPTNYYNKGGNNISYMRDEQYAFFIRWIYNTGDRSDSYHIPGRAAESYDLDVIYNDDVFESQSGVQIKRWQVQNTCTIESATSYTLADGGTVIATGKMGYWESTEKYPADKSNIWGDLCGQSIRHHKMPDETKDQILSTYKLDGEYITILGVEFDNITHPLDNDGNPITSIVGYEILRGSREGNKSIIAKGIVNNMRQYTIPGNNGVTGLYQNYPYNDLRPDSYLTQTEQTGDNGYKNPNGSLSKLSNYSKDVFSFHSPETTFSNPYLNPYELKIYQEIYGESEGMFIEPYKHPKFKQITDGLDSALDALALAISLIQGAAAGLGGYELVFSSDNNLPPVKTGVNTLLLTGLSSVVGAGVQTGVAVGAAIANLALTTAYTLMFGTRVTKQQLLKMVLALIPKRQYATQYISHGFYNKSKIQTEGSRRRKIVDSIYNRSGVQSFSNKYQVNNLMRGNMIIVQTEKEINNPTEVDDSRVILGEITQDINQVVKRKISSRYGSLKLSIDSQYGQLESVKQIPISAGLHSTVADKITRLKSPVLFNGDVYINRFTEKNTMYFFNTWLSGEPDLMEINYANYATLPYPRFWINNQDYIGIFADKATNHRSFDAVDSKWFYINKGHFYLFNSGIRDFYVESEINLAYRDWEDDYTKRHYDPFTFSGLDSLKMMFQSDLIRAGNYYKYDYSLSISKLINSHISWGNVLDRNYDPLVASTCYTYRPNRVMYSLPQGSMDSRKDNWRAFLVNNFKDFDSPVTSIKAINKSGALFMMKRQSPKSFLGQEELKLDTTGAKVTIGDGQLFTQPLQNLANSDESYEYGSCQNKYGVTGTPYGIYWVSQEQGKVFNYYSGLNEISKEGMKWWFARHLPSELLKVYPNYPHADNPVKGVGVQMIYDNTNEIVYISKKDYKPKRKDLKYDSNGFYYTNGSTTVTIPGKTTSTCPPGYFQQGNQCVKIDSIEPTQSGTVITLTETPYQSYGNLGTKIYSTASISGSYVLLNTSNSFWIRTANPVNWGSYTAAQKQAYDLNNGPVNRLAKWGVTGSPPANNYTVSGSIDPVGVWIGFDVCINITQTKTYYVSIAGDNRYRFSLDGTVILEDSTQTTNAFNYLHFYPITITAGSHILKVEGYNDGNYAGFGCEIFDFSDFTNQTDLVNFLNAQTNYDNLTSRIIFTTRTSSTFSSNQFTCPTGYGLTNPTCDKPECRKITYAPLTTTQAPSTTTTVVNKVYCNFDNTDCWEDASWTISYDPKQKTWISFHDWKPTFLIPGKSHFLSVLNKGIWKHNVGCDKFCNFYDVDYPFEVEFVSSTGQMVNSLRNIEYILEAYKYHNDCQDKFHVLDANFDKAIVYNSEQVSGVLELYLKNKTNPLSLLSYPEVLPNSIKINFSKEENKYRFNQFWDITKNRGEFDSNINIPMFVTKANGYEFTINPNYVNYAKSPIEHKRFRHNVNRVFLQKVYNSDTKLILKLVNQKLLQSYR